MPSALEQYAAGCGTGWTPPTRAAQTAGVLPWNCIEKLRDHFGDYVVVVSCRTCRHSRELTPAFLARRCRRGWDEPVASLIARFRCRCGGKSVEVQVAFDRKPRGWVKNPS